MKLRRLIPASVAGAAIAATCAIAFSAASSASNVHEIPRDQWEVPSEGVWLKSEDMSVAALKATEELDQYLDFPSEEAKAAVIVAAKNAEFDYYGLYAGGSEYNFALDLWTCQWAAFAREAADRGDRDSVIIAGKNLAQRITFPGQRESWGSEFEAFARDGIDPLIAGDFESSRALWETQCFAPGEVSEGGLK